MQTLTALCRTALGRFPGYHVLTRQAVVGTPKPGNVSVRAERQTSSLLAAARRRLGEVLAPLLRADRNALVSGIDLRQDDFVQRFVPTLISHRVGFLRPIRSVFPYGQPLFLPLPPHQKYGPQLPVFEK